MKKFLLALMVLTLVGSSSLMAVTDTAERHTDGPRSGYLYITESHLSKPGGGTHSSLSCSGPGQSPCKWETHPLGAFPSNFYQNLEDHALEQIDLNNNSGTWVSNLYYNNVYYSRNVTWEVNTTTGATKIDFFLGEMP